MKNLDEYTKRVKTEAAPKLLMRLLALRFLIMPSIALAKYRCKLEITDREREMALLRKVKKYDTLKRLYKSVFQESRKAQKTAVALIKTKKLASSDIVQMSVNEARYYIDCIDALILALWKLMIHK
ncbi:MAG: chorismate mutase [Candidatus Jacksonbacteria bacterium]|nr:chorismate mutase [Candidatus Jacksonbacteria bacterium]